MPALLMQRQLHDMYQSYFEEDPASHTPPIPTAFLSTPGSRTGRASRLVQSQSVNNSAADCHLSPQVSVPCKHITSSASQLHRLTSKCIIQAAVLP